MAPRAYWKGTLKLSFVSCPVVLYPASTSVEKTRFHMINKETGNRLKQQMVDAETGDVVESDQKGRGYELKKGQYVEIEKEELEAVQIESNHTIEIDSFVPRDEIDKRYYNNPYYVAPDGKAAIDAFAVIRDAMKDEDRVALARIVLTNREHVIAIEPLGKGLLGTTLRYPYELRDEDDYFDDIKTPKITKDMVELASHILQTKAAHFDPSKFKDEYEDALKALVRRKASGKPIKAAEREEKPDNVVNLMDALKASLKGKPAGKRAGSGFAAGAGAPGGEEGASVGGEAAQGGVILTHRHCETKREAIQSSRWDSGLLVASLCNDGATASSTASTSSPFSSSQPSASSSLLRHLLALGPRLRQSDRDRLLAARDLPARTAAPQRAGLALLHHAFDIAGGLLRIFACHCLSPASSFGEKVITRRMQSSSHRLALTGDGRHFGRLGTIETPATTTAPSPRPGRI